MKKKELVNLAKKFAKFERIISTSEDEVEIQKAQEEIMKLSKNISNFEDLIAIDEMVMEILENS